VGLYNTERAARGYHLGDVPDAREGSHCLDEVMKAGQGMQQAMRYMELDTGLREGVAKGSGLWTALFAVIFVFVALVIVLRVVVKRVADQKTRRIILESMQDTDDPKPARDDAPPVTPPAGERDER
jgi:hypothetical protein